MLEYLKDNYWILLLILNYVIAISAVVTVILKNINPTKTMSYIIILVVFPFFGVVVYYLFGQEYRKNKIFSRKYVLNQSTIKSINEDLVLSDRKIKAVDDVLDAKIKLVQLLCNNKSSPLTLCNEIDI